MAGRFITLEGIEGSGKSSVTRALVEQLGTRGIAVQATREPGGSPLAEKLRAIVLERGTESLTPVAETLLMFSARAVHLENLIRPALARGAWVVCDRFTDATRAYQGAGRNVDGELIESLARAVHGDLWPARTLLLDVSPEQGMQRARSRGGVVDRFESEALEFFARVRARYLRIAAAEPERVRVIDASRPLSDVIAASMEAVLDG